MRKISTVLILAVVLTLIGSCSKKTNVSGNSFTFRGVSYPIDMTTRDSVYRTIVFTSLNTSPSATLMVTFADSFPNQVGNDFQTFVEAGNPAVFNYQKLQLTIGSRNYYPTGNGATSIYYNLSSTNKLKIYTNSNYPIMMSGGLPGGAVDSSQVSFTVSE